MTTYARILVISLRGHTWESTYKLNQVSTVVSPDDTADLLERLCAGILHLLMRVPQNLNQLGHNRGQAGGQLLGRAEGHRAQQLHRTGFGAPLILLQGSQKAGQHQLHSVRGQLGHDGLRAVVCCFAHVLVGVAEAEQEVWQDVHDVGLEEAAEHVAELGEGEEGALAVPRIFLILPPYLVG